MERDKEELKAEDLSIMIDALNNKFKVDNVDQEMQELLAVAAMVKTAAGHNKPAQQRIDALAGKLAEEAKTKASNRRFKWIYSGAAGMAAAVMLVVAMNTSSVTPVPQISNGGLATQEIQQSAVMPNPETTQERQKPGGEVADKSSQVGIITENLQHNQNTVNSRTVSEPHKQNPAVNSGTVPETNSALARTYKARVTEKPSISEPAKQMAVLAIPGRNAKVLTVDSENGIVKQVYDIEGNKEITITQRRKASSDTKNTDPIYSVVSVKEDRAVDDKDQTANDQVNQITKSTDIYEVTVEGELSKDKLQEIADSLAETIE
ncbi:hypothetical protein SDC9_13820 [bioreactor metagenome]|uniref:DUF4367 domain-containing protein n=1 Tax=bioreactor metagenome TaxID=1076179 RepID=A0A644TNV6_9ZZZZ|nr:hypothetical protein [Negativicutes bacterium]